MEYHTYDSLFKVIKYQYPKSQKKEDAIFGNLANAYQVPSTENLLKVFKTVTTPQEKPIEKDDINSYIYVNR